MAAREEVSSLVERARQGDAAARHELLASHQEYILKVVSWRCGRPVDCHSDEYSIGLMAFNEAIESYDPARGAAFLSYARRVIAARLADHYRRDRARGREVPLEVTGPEGETETHPGVISAAEEASARERERRERLEEITAFCAELAAYGLTLEDVAAACPRHRDARARLLKAGAALAASPALLAHLKRTRQVPLKELAELTGLSYKLLERGRRYLLAVALIRANPDYAHLAGYVEPYERGWQG
ncbi:sigma-70 family RNA polymerase sigma factor [Gelria sp. Kuro-4]|uniref:sigma-70 family RNA polymerase sigma factor n=1 Tax=Gelria sp. Kuro-4 TaxID=2796927 RepID=UPI001BF17917|nr:sigma-70 family RNA polymerase sigma factor [Gelria sp. Kuro-4]BCV24042.1 RNA polymerase sigma factor SigI [Gelria sp. Kuro-4]